MAHLKSPGESWRILGPRVWAGSTIKFLCHPRHVPDHLGLRVKMMGEYKPAGAQASSE